MQSGMPWYRVFANVSPRALRVWQRDADVFQSTILVNFIPPLLEPVLYILAFGFGLGSLVGEVSYQGRDLSYLRFMVPGVLSVAVMFWSYFENTYSSFVRMYYQQTFDAIVATPLLVEDVIVGEWLWGTTKAVMASTIMLIMISFFGLVSYPTALLVIPVGVLGGLLFAALGLITTSLVPQIDSFNIATFVLIFPMFLFSGTFFPISVYPDWLEAIVEVTPLYRGVHMLRSFSTGEVGPMVLVDIAYLALMGLVGVAITARRLRRLLLK